MLPQLPRSQLKRIRPLPVSGLPSPGSSPSAPGLRGPGPWAPRPSLAPPGHLSQVIETSPLDEQMNLAATGRGKRGEARVARWAGLRNLPRLSSLLDIQSVLVAMKTGHTPATPDRGSQVRRRARPSAHEQCCSEPASHGLRRQRRRCRCHYGPLQSEGGAAWLGACGR